MTDFIHRIRQRVVDHPSNPCVIDNDGVYTYNDFWQKTLRIASFLSQHEYSKVVINMKQGISAYAAIVAALIVDGCFCPLNLESPLERKQWTIDQFRPNLIISNSELMLPDKSIAFIQISIDEILKNEWEKKVDESTNYNQENIAYVIYTSGSTGHPKGVMIPRKGLNRFLSWSLPAFNSGPGDKWSQYSALSFDLSIVDIFTALSSGATLVTFSEQGQKLRPAHTISKHQITIWHSVPGAIDFMMRSERSRPAELSSIRIMSFCGEPLFPRHLEYLFLKNRNIEVFNTYGPTEATLFCTWIKLTNKNYVDYIDCTMSIGKPIPEWHIELNPLEEDPELNEVVIYSDFIGRGYLNCDSDAYNFLQREGRLYPSYRTGDLVRVKEGNLYFVSRKDNQIKLRGYRIELEEIDHWIMGYTGVKSMSILYNDAIHSFIEGDVEIALLIQFLESKIEKYKIPSYFYSIDSLPRNLNLKVDRNTLKKIIDEKGETYGSI